MAHYAFLDQNNVVTHVIVGKNENEDGIDWEQWYGEFVGQTCKRTSYNTINNRHLLNGVPFRGNYAGIGYTFDPNIGEHGVFIPPKPYNSWVFDEIECTWVAPIARPSDASMENPYQWNEETLSWESVING